MEVSMYEAFIYDASILDSTERNQTRWQPSTALLSNEGVVHIGK